MKYKYTNELKGFNDTQTCICGNKVYINKQEVIGYDYNIRHIICYGVCSCGRKVIYFNKIIIDKGRFLSNGVEILIDSDHILVTNNNLLIRGCCATNCHGGLIIGPTPMPIGGFMSLQSIDRYLGDSKASLAWAKSVKKEFNK